MWSISYFQDHSELWPSEEEREDVEGWEDEQEAGEEEEGQEEGQEKEDTETLAETMILCAKYNVWPFFRFDIQR